MLITNEDNNLSFRNAFEKTLKGSDSIKIATGYIGASEIIKYQEQFCEISKKGGIVQIIHGMGGVEGIRSSLYNKLVELDTKLQRTNCNNRVLVHRTHYHGKMYITERSNRSQVLIGSSNFSSSGFEKNFELNYCHTANDVCDQASQLFDRLKKNSFFIDKILLPDRNKLKVKTEKFHDFDPTIYTTPPDKSIEIRVTEASNLNLFLSKGRLNRKTNVYTPRPFDEVELTIVSADLNDLRKYLPDQLAPAEFRAVTDLGSTFMVKFKRKTSSQRDLRSLHQTGIDFMSTSRESGGRKQLGQYMKSKLMKVGLLNFGDPVTDDVLDEYGKRHLDLYFVGKDILYIKF